MEVRGLIRSTSGLRPDVIDAVGWRPTGAAVVVALQDAQTQTAPGRAVPSSVPALRLMLTPGLAWLVVDRAGLHPVASRGCTGGGGCVGHLRLARCP